MIPLSLLPGFGRWGAHLEALLARPEGLWIHGPGGAGVSTTAAELARRRGGPWIEAGTPEEGAAWAAAHPGGVVAGPGPMPAGLPCLELRLPALEEDPACLPDLLAALADEEGVAAPWPPSLGTLPCPGNLRELRNRLVRWKLLGQLPGPPEPAGPPRFEAEDLATNLHELERFLLHRALRRAYGNRVEAALRLGVSRRQLYLLVRRHGDPVRGEPASGELPRRLQKRKSAQNSSRGTGIR